MSIGEAISTILLQPKLTPKNSDTEIPPPINIKYLNMNSGASHNTQPEISPDSSETEINPDNSDTEIPSPIEANYFNTRHVPDRTLTLRVIEKNVHLVDWPLVTPEYPAHEKDVHLVDSPEYPAHEKDVHLVDWPLVTPEYPAHLKWPNHLKPAVQDTLPGQITYPPVLGTPYLVVKLGYPGSYWIQEIGSETMHPQTGSRAHLSFWKVARLAVTREGENDVNRVVNKVQVLAESACSRMTALGVQHSQGLLEELEERKQSRSLLGA